MNMALLNEQLASLGQVPDPLPKRLPRGMRSVRGRVTKSELELCEAGQLFRECGPYYFGNWEESEERSDMFDCTPAGLDWIAYAQILADGYEWDGDRTARVQREADRAKDELEFERLRIKLGR